MLRRYAPLAGFLLLVIAAAVVSGLFDAGHWWHVKAAKPVWTPPGWLMGVAWAGSWLLLALAAWLVFGTGHPDRRRALSGWGIVLLLIVAWNALFFGAHRIGWAWLEMGLLLVAAVWCFRAFRRISSEAGYLLLPPMLWLFFVWALNLAVWTLNGGLFARVLL